MVIERGIRVATLTHKQYLIQLYFVEVYYPSKQQEERHDTATISVFSRLGSLHNLFYLFVIIHDV